MYAKHEIPLHHRLPMTRIRLGIAHLLYRILYGVFRSNQHRIHRNGVYYDVDLSEALDLSVFLFGHFQSHVTNPKYFPLSTDAIVFDVGANFGVLSLRFAQLAPQGRVYAFEPTDYAFEKLRRNLALNPELAKRIVPVQAFVSDTSTRIHRIPSYSSWRIDRERLNAHPVHGGLIQLADHVGAITIDDFCDEHQVDRVDSIKIDTDGHEYWVLQGARRTIERHRPSVTFEIGMYLMDERGIRFEQYDEYFTSLGYTLLNSKNGRTVTGENYLKQIPLYSTTDILAIP